MSIDSGKRSLAKLKIIQNSLRPTVEQERLNNLILKSIESDLVWKQDISDLVKDFAEKKKAIDK